MNSLSPFGFSARLRSGMYVSGRLQARSMYLAKDDDLVQNAL